MMSYYLDVPHFTNRFINVNIPAPTDSGGYNFEFEFECQATATDLILNGTTSVASNDIFFLKSSVVEYRRTGNTSINMTHGVNIANWNNYRFVFTGPSSGAGNIAFYVNGVFKSNHATSSSIATPVFLALLGLSAATRIGKFRFFKFTDLNNSASNRMYDARAYVPGDLILRETANNQNGNFTDNSSAWGARPPAFISEGGTAPIGTVTIGTITPNSTGASAPFTYSAADQTGFEYQLNETGTIYPISASPATPTGLSPSTAYTIRARAVNATGPGAWSTSAPFTTSGVAVSFVGGPVPDQVATVGVPFSLDVRAYFTGTLTPFTYSLTTGNFTGTGLSHDTATSIISGTPTATASVDVQERATDTGTNTAVTNLFNITINPASDVTAPTFTAAPAVTGITQTGGTATATINETGSIFYVIVPQAESTPSGPQVIAGQNAAGGAPIDSGSAVDTTTLSDPFTGTTAGAAYKACFVARDDEPTPNVQANVTVVNFTAASAPVGTITLINFAANTAVLTGAVSNITCMVLADDASGVVVIKPGLAIDSNSDLTFNDAAIVPGTWYTVVPFGGNNRAVIRVQAT